MIFVDKELALEMGFTHEGTIAGVPCWMTMDSAGIDVAAATPKCQPLQIWLSLADWLYDAMTWLIPPSARLEFPITVGAALK